ncbi:hypothetical protein C8N24_4862 [Solirubrobacter pauli]|uniref:Uncharacterized protein n=1 Tax=Solirubrobacter pauli TaxID=166793 RepID=A0A660KYS2_9ACTN|nr:hypothetical protein [Solirubrobacter pauli]RKQ86847.1 hypothetical protein C8N24_4862 [Solirubrobacter pauli]
MKRCVLTAVLAATAAVTAPPAQAQDADATAVALADGRVYVGGSAFHSGDLRSSVVGRWNPQTAGFDWLERVEGALGSADGVTDLVAAGGYLYSVGYGNGGLVVAKLDPDTGTLQRACGPTGVTVNSLGTAILPGRAAALGRDLVVVGGTLALPTRGVIAIVDGGTCTVRASATIGGPDAATNVGFTSVALDASGAPIAAGFSGTDAALFRFGADLLPGATRTFDLGGLLGDAFTAVGAAPGSGVAVGLSGTALYGQCFTLPALTADTRCGAGGRRALSFGSGGAPTGTAALTRLASGSWLVGGSQLGWGTPAGWLARAAVAAFEPAALEPAEDVLAPSGARVLDPFPYLPSSFAAVAATPDRIAGIGTAGYIGARRPFLYSARADGAAAAITPLDGFATAPPAPVEPGPPEPQVPTAPPTAPAPPAAAKRPALATARFLRLAKRPDRRGGFGTVALACARACSVHGTYTAKVRGRTAPLGSTSVRLRAGSAVRLRLVLSRRGRQRLRRAQGLPTVVRFRVTGERGDRALFQTSVALRARA